MVQAYLPGETPELLRPYREDELVILRGNGNGMLEEWDRVYDYALYNDLAEPEDKRPIIGGSSRKTTNQIRLVRLRHACLYMKDNDYASIG